MQPHSSPRVRSLGFATIVLAIVVATIVLTPGVALAAQVGCHSGGDSSWVLQEAQVAQPGGNAGAPVTDGCSAYWADDSSGNLDIYGVDLGSGTQSTVAAAPAQDPVGDTAGRNRPAQADRPVDQVRTDDKIAGAGCRIV